MGHAPKDCSVLFEPNISAVESILELGLEDRICLRLAVTRAKRPVMLDNNILRLWAL